MTSAPAPLYALRLLAPGHFTLAKFSMPDFNVEATYNLTAKGHGYTCDCPASARMVKLRPCKHQRMIPFMMGACNTDRFYEPESRSWCQPLAPDLVGEAAQQSGAPTEPPKYPKPELSEGALQMLEEAKRAPFTAEPPKLRRRV